MNKELPGIKGPTCDLCNKTLVSIGVSGTYPIIFPKEDELCYVGKHYTVQYDFTDWTSPKIVGYTCEGQTYSPEEWEKVKKLKAWL
jgi:hypothetical protein